MIERFKANIKHEYGFLLDFVLNNTRGDFYYTANDFKRVYVTDVPSLKKFIKSGGYIYTKKEKGDYVGIILAIATNENGKVRHYVKMSSKSPTIAKDLLTVLLWNCKKELFFRVKKYNRIMQVFKEKGFRFVDIRGDSILLNRKPLERKESPIYIKKEDYE